MWLMVQSSPAQTVISTHRCHSNRYNSAGEKRVNLNSHDAPQKTPNDFFVFLWFCLIALKNPTVCSPASLFLAVLWLRCHFQCCSDGTVFVVFSMKTAVIQIPLSEWNRSLFSDFGPPLPRFRMSLFSPSVQKIRPTKRHCIPPSSPCLFVFFNIIHKKPYHLWLSADRHYEYKTLVLLKTQTSPAATAYLHKPVILFASWNYFTSNPRLYGC